MPENHDIDDIHDIDILTGLDESRERPYSIENIDPDTADPLSDGLLRVRKLGVDDDRVLGAYVLETGTGVVRVFDRSAPECHHGVADVLVDGALGLVHDARHRRQVLVHQP